MVGLEAWAHLGFCKSSDASVSRHKRNQIGAPDEDLRRRYWTPPAALVVGKFLFSTTAMFGLFGALFQPQPLGIIIGAAIGLIFGIDKAWRTNCGRLTITVDGRRRTSRCTINNNTFQQAIKRAAELRIREEDEPIPFIGVNDEADENIRDAWFGYAAHLRKADGQRRLVIELRAGQPELQITTSLGALDAMGAGRPVYMVTGNEPEYHCHAVAVSGTDWYGSKAYSEAVQWVDCRFKYRLTRLSFPVDLINLEEGLGLPEGVTGIYRNKTTLNQRVAERYSIEISIASKLIGLYKQGHSYRHHRSLRQVNSIPDAKFYGQNAKIYEAVIIDGTLFGALAGAMVGMAAGATASLTGGPLLALTATGIVAGSALGTFVIRRRWNGDQNAKE